MNKANIGWATLAAAIVESGLAGKNVMFIS